MNKDYYQVLGIESNAGSKKIKEAYREQAFKYHPDRNEGNPEASEKMKAVNEAYAVLSNPSKRREYDMMKQEFGSSAYNHFRKSHSDEEIFSGSDINRILEEMAKSFGFRGVDDIFREFYGQQYKSFEFKNPGFFGGGFIFSGDFGKSSADEKLPKPGYFSRVVQFFIESVSGVEFPKEGEDLEDIIVLSPELARDGGPYAYFHRKKSKKLVVKIPPGIRDGQRIRLSEMGKVGKGGGKSGDMYLKVQVKRSLLGKIRNLISS